MGTKPHWTAQEIALLKESYVSLPKESLVSLLHHSWRGITKQARRRGLEARPHKPHSEGTKAKMAETRRRAWASPEYRANWLRSWYSRVPSNPFTPRQEQIILGTVLGDGHLSLQKANAQFITSVAVGDKDYLFWKYEELKSTGLFREPILHRGPSYGNPEYPSWRMESRRHPIFTELQKLFYKDRKKVISQEILSRVESLGLAVWYMDDGSLTFWDQERKRPLVRLHVEGFGKEGCLLIGSWLQQKFGLHPTSRMNKRGEKWIIYLSGMKKVQAFMEVVEREIVEAMIRKSLRARLALIAK